MASKNSLGAGKLLLGCGCFMALIMAGLLAVAIAMGVGGFMVAKEVAEDNKDLIKEAKELAKNQGELVDKLEKRAKTTASSTPSPIPRVTQADFLAFNSTPLTPADVRHHQEFMRAWGDSKAIHLIQESGEVFRALDTKNAPGMLEQLRAIKQIKDIATESGPASEELDRLATAHGGSEAVFRRYYQLLTLAAIADGVARHRDKTDLTSDATADAMLSERAAASQEFQKWSTAHRAYYESLVLIQKDSTKAQQLLDDPAHQALFKDMSQTLQRANKQPGMLLLGKIPPQTLKTWRGLSTPERDALIETFKQTPFLSLYSLSGKDAKLPAVAQHILGLESAHVYQEALKATEAAP